MNKLKNTKIDFVSRLSQTVKSFSDIQKTELEKKKVEKILLFLI